ncbi:DNA translocase FtsK, partial [Acinetobacter baumannii]
AESQDALFDRAVAIVVRERRASVSLLERRLNLSRPWALALLERLEDAGIVGPSDGNGHRHLRADTAA